jgi:hypothetical protein
MLMHHKDTASPYQRAIKAVLPDYKTPEDTAAPIIEPYVARLKELEEWRAAQLAERQRADEDGSQRAFDRDWSDTVKEYDMTEEGQEKLISYMKERKLADPAAAAALYYKQNPKIEPISPTSISPQGWARDMGFTHDKEDTDTAFLMAKPEAWADKEAASVLNEVRRVAA